MQPAFLTYTPREPLSSYVDYFWMCWGYAPAHPLERVLPTGTMGLFIRLDEESRDGATVGGARSRSILLDTSNPLSIIGVSFKAGGGFPFFGLPAGELNNLSVSLETLLGSDAQRLCDRLLESQAATARFQLLERFLLGRLRGSNGRTPAVCHALDRFQRANGQTRVADAAAEIGWSAGRFVAQFRDEVGLAPKTFCRVVRFRKVIDRLATERDVDWSDIALSCGYFDQAHFGHDFKEFAGVTPSDYLRHRTSTNHIRVVD